MFVPLCLGLDQQNNICCCCKIFNLSQENEIKGNVKARKRSFSGRNEEMSEKD